MDDAPPAALVSEWSPVSCRPVFNYRGWDTFPARQAEARKQGRYVGIGLSQAVKGTGRGPFETGIVRVNPSGRVSIYTGATAMGQGLGTSQIADKLCLSVKTIETYREHLKEKLNLSSGQELLRYAIEWSLAQA